MPKLRFLAISGSLRNESLNSNFLRSLSEIPCKRAEIIFDRTITKVPLFNPDDEQRLPSSVVKLRKLAVASDGLIIASPEYAHGISSVLKTTLDWLVGSEELYQKPTILINLSNRATHADNATREILKTMSLKVLDESGDAPFCIPRELMDFDGNTEKQFLHRKHQRIIDLLIKSSGK